MSNNITNSINRVAEAVKSAGPDGISLYKIVSSLDMKEHGVKSFLGTLIKQGKVTKHPNHSVYFWDGDERPEKGVNFNEPPIKDQEYKLINPFERDNFTISFSRGNGKKTFLDKLKELFQNE